MAVAIPLIFAAGGAWAGTAVGIGAAAGWAIGSAIGSIVEQQYFGPQVPSNSLTDLSVQTSSWGSGLPEIFGVQRVAGNIIWSTDKKLVGGNQGKFGGKGGGGGKGGKSGGKKGGGQQGYYECGIAFALCEGPIAGIKRIWAGGDLIFDDSAPVYVPSMDPNNQQGGYQQFAAANQPLLSTGGSSLGNWTLYHGTGQQTADPTIAANGSANGDNGVPYQEVTLQNGFEYTYGSPSFGKLGTACAYRGVAYIVFPNLNIGYGGSIPPLTFEVVGKQPTLVLNGLSAISGPTGITYPAGVNASHGPYAAKNWSGSGACVLAGDYLITGDGSNPTFQGITNINTGQFTPIINSTYYPNGNMATISVAILNGAGVTFAGEFYFQSAAIPSGQLKTLSMSGNGAPLLGFCANGQTWFTSVPPQNTNFTSPSYLGSTDAYDTRYSDPIQVAPPGSPTVTLTNNQIPVIGGVAYYFSGTNLIAFNPPRNFNVIATGLPQAPVNTFTDGTFLYAAMPASNNQVEIYQVDTSGNTVLWRTCVYSYATSFFFANGWLYSVANTASGTGNNITKYNTDGSLRYVTNFTYAIRFAFVASSGIVLAGTVTGASPGGGYVIFQFADTAIIPQPVTLPSVLADICSRAGFTSYDTSLVPNLSVNLTRHAGTAARDVLKTICQIYAIDMVDSAGTLRFVPKGQPISAQMQIADIGFSKPSKGQVAPAPYILTRAQGTDLPRSVTLKYTSALANWNTYAQQFQISDPYGKDVTVSVPMTLDDQTALNAAMLLCAAPHIERSAYSWTTSLEWLQLEPGDVVQMPWGVTRITSVTLRDTQNQPAIEFNGVIDATYVLNSGNGNAQAVATPTLAASVQAQNALTTGSGGSFVATKTGASGNLANVPTRPPLNVGSAYAQYFEVPPLTSKDTTPYYLIAPYVSGGSFVGAAIWESTDGGTTFTDLAQQASSGIVGFASNVAPNTQPYTWDTTTVLNVYLNSSYMQLSGATDLQVIQGANLALLGNELIQFANANLMVDAQGNSYYQLSRLLRGRRGTEWAMSSHQAGDTFVLIQANDETAIDYGLHDLNNSALFKIATVGQDISAIGATPFAPTGIWYKPWAPAHPRVAKDASNNWNLSFFARARLNGYWGSGVAPTLDTDTQTWSLDVLSGSTVKRTVTGPLSSPAFQYTAAMQTADGFAAGAHGITFTIYQVGQLGRGYSNSVTT